MAKPRVLIVEDELAILAMYRDKLELDGFTVDVAGDGEEGLTKAVNFHPDLILLDILMPKMDGLATLRQLKAPGSVTEDIKVIMLTNKEDTKTAAEIFKLAASDYIVKSDLTPAQISERVRQVLDGEAAGEGDDGPIKIEDHLA